MHRDPRGSALLIATIAMLIIAVIGIALVRFTQRETAGASAAERAEILSSCADAGRGLILSKFHALGADPKTIALLGSDGTLLDGPTGRMRAIGGHIGEDPAVSATVVQVEDLPQSVLGPQKRAYESSNRLSKLGAMGGTPMKVTVHCQEGDLSTPTSGRQLELEFAIVFGL
jgi:hypothetical protein